MAARREERVLLRPSESGRRRVRTPRGGPAGAGAGVGGPVSRADYRRPDDDDSKTDLDRQSSLTRGINVRYRFRTDPFLTRATKAGGVQSAGKR